MRIFSDPHLGLDRKSHTTKASRTALKDKLREQAIRACTEGNPESVVCAGDLFDTFSNSEDDIIAAAQVAEHCDVILAGNHDSLNERDSQGSLDIVAELLADTTVIKCPDFGLPHVEYGELEGMELAFIPHHANQELFDKAIKSVTHRVQRLRAVFLHCNYDNALVTSSDTSLNLTKAQALQLLEISDYVFIGHEHAPRELLGGKLIMVGNVFPTSFGDISDKYYWDLTATELKKTLVWEKAEGYAEVSYNPESPAPTPQAEFIEITGQITADKGADLAAYIKQCWEDSNPLMVRNNVTILSDFNVSTESVDFHTLPDEIEGQLKGTELEPLWNKYRGQVQC